MVCVAVNGGGVHCPVTSERVHVRKILVASLSVHWMVIFALAAFSAAPEGAGPLLTPALLATGYGLVATLFLWTAIAAWGGSRCDEIAALAVAVAALVLAAAVSISGMEGATAMQIAALGATYLVIRAEAQTEPPPATIDWSGEMARRLALGAAHGSMLSRLSQREPAGGKG